MRSTPPTLRRHLWNPRWPRHAKFHNVQTMVMGIFGGGLSLVLLFDSGTLTRPLFMIATAAAASYFVSMALAPLVPGAAWTDPEFSRQIPRPLGLAPQQIVTYLLCGVVLVALALAWG